MTREGQEPRPEDTLVPPASTRWSETGSAEEEGLVPPFVPGQAGRRAAPAPDTTGRGSGPAEPAEPAEPHEAHEAHEAPWPTGPAGTEPRMEPEPADAVEEAFPFDMPWAEEPEPGSYPADGEEEAADAAGAVDEFPMDAFDIDPVADPGAVSGGLPGEATVYGGGGLDAPYEGDYGAAELEEADYDGPAAGVEPAGRGSPAVEEVAERLERLASQLRTEGADGVERELASSDRLTSLLAALLAGHLASR